MGVHGKLFVRLKGRIKVNKYKCDVFVDLEKNLITSVGVHWNFKKISPEISDQKVCFNQFANQLAVIIVEGQEREAIIRKCTL